MLGIASNTFLTPILIVTLCARGSEIIFFMWLFRALVLAFFWRHPNHTTKMRPIVVLAFSRLSIYHRQKEIDRYMDEKIR